MSIEPLQLSMTQSFEIERMKRAVDETTNIEELKELTKQLISAWHSQKAATAWVMRQQLGGPPKVRSI